MAKKLTKEQEKRAIEISFHAGKLAESGQIQMRREDLAEKIAAQARADLLKAPIPTGDLAAEFAALLANITPRSPAEIRANDFRTIIAPRLADFGFSDRYQVDGLLEGPDPRIASQREVLAKLDHRLASVGAIIALVGPRGTGKTTITAQLAAARVWREWEIASRPGRHPTHHWVIAYRKLSAVIARLKALYADFGTVDGEALEAERDHLCSLDLLILDEIAEVADESKRKDPILTDLLDRRYAARLDTILISNQTPDNFRETINPSIASRIAEHGSIIRCEWPSFRTTPATPVQP